jgi:membrane fusion protein (multidrug efflux system)
MDQTMTAQRAADGRNAPPAATDTSRRRSLLKRVALGTVAVLVLAGAAEFGTEYWRTGRFMVSTDDAYVQADNTLIAPRVSGYISDVLVTDNQPVKAGQVLARIDDRDYQTALRGATADRETAEADIRSIDAQQQLQASLIAQAEQQVTAADAALRFAQQDEARYETAAGGRAAGVARQGRCAA